MKIALDIDGVLSEFDMGTESKEEWLTKFPDFVRNKGFENLPIKKDAWEIIDFLEECLNKNILDEVFYLSSAGGIEVELLSEVTRQKIKWLRDNDFPNWTPVVVHRKGMKKHWAKSDVLLIDDQLCNVEDFVEMAGLGLVHISAERTLDVLKLLLWDKLMERCNG